MKNLKKVLALVLVVVMALGLITVSNAAAFTDENTITKTEAVDVLTAVGVIKGYEDGSFKPEGEVTRAEMAKMIAVIMNKGEDVGELYKNACKFADSANHWAAGYIAYCAQAGIINGKNATTFDPDGKVTGTEAAKMLLCALGYKADVEGFVGANWASAALAKAAEVHLVGKSYNMTANMAEALNRENAAQMMLNALKADMVKYDGSATTISGNGFVISTGAEAKSKKDTNVQYSKINKDGVTGEASATNPYVIQLGEEMFEGDLELKGADSDSFGRPAQMWTYKSNEVSRAPKAADHEYKDVLKAGTLYADLGKLSFEGNFNAPNTDKKNDKFVVEYYKNGVKDASLDSTLVEDVIKSAGKTEFGQVGDTIEVYVDTTDEIIRIIEIDYFVGKITLVSAAKTTTAGDVTKVGYITIDTTDSGATDTYKYEGTTIPASSIPTEAFTSADVEAIVIYTVGISKDKDSDGKTVIKSVAKAESVTGLFSTSVANTDTTLAYDTVTIAGTTYKATPSIKIADRVDQNQDVTAYLDPNGNVAKIEGVTSNDYVYMIMNDVDTAKFGKATDIARLIFNDGTVKEVAYKLPNDATTGPSDADKLYTYTKDSKDVYTLTEVVAPTLIEGNGNWAASTKVNYFSGLARVNNDTLFIVETWDSSAKAATYTTYTGVSNLPTIESTTYNWGDTYKGADESTVHGNASTSEAGANRVVMTKRASEDFASVVYIFGAKTKSASTKVTALFFSAKDPLTKDAEGNESYAVKAIVEGAETKLNTTSTAHGTGNADGTFAVADSLALDSNGTIDAKPVDGGNVTTYGAFVDDGTKFTGTYKGGNIVLYKTVGTSGASTDIEEMNVDPSLPVYVYNTESNEITITTIGAYVPAGDPSDNYNVNSVVKVLRDTTTDKNPIAFYVWETNE